MRGHYCCLEGGGGGTATAGSGIDVATAGEGAWGGGSTTALHVNGEFMVSTNACRLASQSALMNSASFS